MSQPSLIRLATQLAFVFVLVACNKPTVSVSPQEITAGTTCSLDGMTLADFAGPKGQIHYATGEPDFFCDTAELLSIYLRPEQKKRITGIFTQDMGQTDWETPHSHWIDAKLAFYVLGSNKTGSMGPTLATFSTQQDAEKFAKKFGGTVLAFDKITPDMVDLTGSAMHDERM